MDGTPFEVRVRSLREGWVERRESNFLSRSHDFDSQSRVLANIHRWASECIEDVRHVYGDAFPITIDPLDDSAPFSIAVGAVQNAPPSNWSTGEAPSASSWQVVARVATGGGEAGEAPEERRVRHWRRSQVEEILLSLLSAYERSLSREVSA